LALLPALFAGGCSHDSSSNSDGGGGPVSTDARQLCVDTINNYRATIGRAPYQRWTATESCVDGEAQTDASNNTAHSAFGTCGEFAQDECPGWPGASSDVIKNCLAQMWAEGPGGGHYDNMSNSNYTEAACGFYITSAGNVWATQNFK
jgi:hypothetical protein